MQGRIFLPSRHKNHKVQRAIHLGLQERLLETANSASHSQPNNVLVSGRGAGAIKESRPGDSGIRNLVVIQNFSCWFILDCCCDSIHRRSARTTDVSICLTGMDQYL